MAKMSRAQDRMLRGMAAERSGRTHLADHPGTTGGSAWWRIARSLERIGPARRSGSLSFELTESGRASLGDAGGAP